MKKNLILIEVLFVFIYVTFFIACGGGGSSGASIPSGEYKTHNSSGWAGGGWETDGGNGGGSGNGNGSRVVISGSTPLSISSYTYNGTSYTNLEELIAAISASGATSTFYVPFVTNGETRQARVTMNGNQCTVEHEYKATITTTDGSTQTISFYKNDGISLSSFAANATATGTGSVTFDQIGWTDGNAVYPSNGAFPYPANQTGDIVVTGLAPAYEKMKVDGGKLAFYGPMVNNGDSFIIPAGVTVNELYLPAGKLVSLDLSAASLPSTIGTDFIGNGNNFESLKEISLPNSGITEIGYQAFDACTNLTTINIPSSVTTIGQSAFNGCSSLTNITIPNGVTTIGQSAFDSCSNLESITIPNSVTTIGNIAFALCSSLESIIIPNSVTTLGNFTFQQCSNLASITLPDNLNVLGSDVFTNCSEDLIFYVSSQTVRNTLCNQLQAYPDPNLGYGFADSAGNAYAADKYKLAARVKIKNATTTPAPSDFVLVRGAIINRQVSDSSVFIDGRMVEVLDTYVCTHEVTQQEFEAIFSANPSNFRSDIAAGETQANRPVEQVNWYHAIAYCNKRSISEGLTPCYTVSGITNWATLSYVSIPTTNNATWNSVICDWTANGYRLPTEAEWEYAARGGNGLTGEQLTYPGNNSYDNIAWYGGFQNGVDTGVSNSNSKTHEVKKKAPNTLGLYDMGGNVWEWLWDRYKDPITTSSPLSGDTSASPRADRGGSWYQIPAYTAVSFRTCAQEPENSYSDLGFRVVRSAQYTP